METDQTPSSPGPEFPPFHLSEETPLAYFTQIVNFIYQPHYARFLRRIANRYEREALPPGLELMPFFVDALIFETYIDGKTPFDDFLTRYQSHMSVAQFQQYKAFKQFRFGVFQVLAHQGREETVLRDLIDDSQITIRDAEARRFLFPHFYAVMRLLPFELDWVPTGACAVFNLKSPQQALSHARILMQAPLMIQT